MRIWTKLGNVLLPALVLCSTACISSEKPAKQDVVKLCQIPIPRDFQDAQFVVTYRLETDPSGVPKNIKKVKNTFLKDEPFISCISSWSLPSISGQAIADFFAKPTEGGWTEIHVSGKGFDQSFRYH